MKYLQKTFTVGGHTDAYSDGWERVFGKKGEGMTDQERDYADMRRFQAQFIEADHRVRELEEALSLLEWSFAQTALRNGGTIYTAILCPACRGEKNPPDDKGPRRQRGDPLPSAGHKPDCWLDRVLRRSAT
jgi:hypothetical protein